VKRILQGLLALVLAVVFLGLFFWKSDLHRVGALLGAVNPLWLLAGAGANFCALLFRTLRWRTILNPDEPPPFYATFVANALGFFCSTVLPVRAGDVARPAILSRKTTIRFSTALGTVLTERILDLLAVLTLMVVYAVIARSRFEGDPVLAARFHLVRATAVVCAVVGASLLTFVVGLIFFHPSVRRLHELLGKLMPERFRLSWMAFFDSFVQSIQLARNHPVASLKVVLFTSGVWLALTSQFSFVFLAMHHPLPYSATFLVNGMSILGLLVPTPGGVGGFHKACQLALTKFYDFDLNSSVAAALLLHLIGTVPVILAGAFVLLREGISWRQLSHIGENVQE
jgi:uncharacterized protein (TIRG00374 family)